VVDTRDHNTPWSYDVQGSTVWSTGGHHTSNVAGVCGELLRRGAEIVGDITGRLDIGFPQGKPG
jgi:hypothetical protein